MFNGSLILNKSKQFIGNLEDVKVRKIFDRFKTNHRILGIVGSRGIGKTTYLLYYLNKYFSNSDKAVYLSADDLFFSQNKIIDFADWFVKEKDGKLICIDEIHRYANWAQELKNIYDMYPNLRIIFSGSSSIDLIKQKYDLSRRVILKYLPGFSFREFLEIKLDTSLPNFSLGEIIKNRKFVNKKITSIPKLLGFFHEYLKIGYYPIFIKLKNEKDIFEALDGIIDKTINIDIASYYSLKTGSLPYIKKLLYFIYTSAPGSISPTKIGKSLAIDKKTVGEYLNMLKESGILSYLLIDRFGHSLIRNAEKVYFSNSNLFYAIENKLGKSMNLGSVRESFVLNQLKSGGYKAFYTKKGDFLVNDKYCFEVGGQAKGLDQVRDLDEGYLVLDNVIFGDDKKIPLYLFGFLY